ncbi:MAG TPA: CHAT domain-containing protein [Thermomonospora sp.]|nr:CHAT domain-containing protein [Thermomonospora sp.]
MPLPELRFDPREQESVRWYLEDFREFPAEPAPAIAADAAALVERLGEQLFTALFTATQEAGALWEKSLPRLADLDVEIDADLAEAVPVPFELLRDPVSGAVPALEARSFTQVPGGAAGPPVALPGPARVLLAICRPREDADVPFRSIGGRLIRSGADLTIDVLRPPTVDALERALKDAHDAGTPYPIVHFDGHGVFGTMTAGPPRGYALFEAPEERGNRLPVDGARLGRLLSRYGVQALVLNACSSARGATPDAQAVRGFPSLAREALDAGLKAVVAMRYDIYVSTAAVFVGGLYDRLSAGVPLSQAASAARADLARRDPDGDPHDEWLVPVVLAAHPLRFTGDAPQQVPVTPETPVYGRDDTVLTLDRGFDRTAVQLLWGAAGVGKTAVAQDFAHWYERTRGVPVPARSTDLTGPGRLDRLRRDAAHLGTGPVLWLWDGLEQDAPWSQEERHALHDILTAILTALDGVKVLITAQGRTAWLPPGVARIQLRPLTPAGQAELVAAHLGAARPDGLDALLDFADGNPRALHLLLGQTARPPDLARLHDGTEPLDTGGFPAALEAAFDETERRVLGLLPWFRRTVTPYHLARLTARLADAVPELDHTAASGLLRRTADLGLLTPLEADFHGISPFLPAAVRGLHGVPTDEEWTARVRREHVALMALFGHGLFWSYNHGNRDVLNVIALEEANLLHTWRTALDHGWYDEAIGPMQALHMLYGDSHRRDAWHAMVRALAPALLDPVTLLPHDDLPLADLSHATILYDYVHGVAHDRDDTAMLEVLRERRSHASARLLRDGADRGVHRTGLRSRAVELLDEGTLEAAREAVNLAHRAHDQPLEASALVSLGHHHLAAGDLRQARRCFEEGFALVADTDRHTLARVFGGLGDVHMAEFGRISQAQLDELVREGRVDHTARRIEVSVPPAGITALRNADRHYQAALNALSGDDWSTTAPIHHMLGQVANRLGEVAEADLHFRKAIEGHERAGDVYRAAQSRYEFAEHLVHRGVRLQEALRYAEHAYRDLSSLKPGTREAERARRLVEELTAQVGSRPDAS